MWWRTLVFALLVAPCQAQEMRHAPSEMELHDKFYSGWLRPDMRDPVTKQRLQSCCGKGDCYPTAIRHDKDGYSFLRKDINPWTKERDFNPRWVQLPDGLLEQNQPDPRESPDGQSHVCDSGYNTFCAVLGAQF